MEELSIEQLYPFITDVKLSRHSLRQLSHLVAERDSIIEEYVENKALMGWMDSGRVENFDDFLESEENLLIILQKEFTKKHPLIKNTKKIIDILKKVCNENI